MSLSEFLKRHHIEPKGIIHIGGTGEEIAGYIKDGFQRVLYIEPNAVKMRAAAEKARGMPTVCVAHCMIDASNGYSLKEGHLVQKRSLDNLLIALRVHPREFNAIVLPAYLERDIKQEGSWEHLAAAQYRSGEMKFLKRRFINLWQGPHGRFANELFQYFFAGLYAKANGLNLFTAPWGGQTLFGLTDQPLQREAPVLEDHDPRPPMSRLWDHMRNPSKEAPGNVCFFGNFQFHTGLFTASERATFKDLFTPVYPLNDALNKARIKALANHLPPVTLVAIHLRRGDYEEGHPGMFYRTPSSSYLTWLRELWPQLNNPVLYIATDDPTCVQDFAEFHPMTSKDLAINIPESYYVDFWMLTQANFLAISNSTFSFAAAMLNGSTYYEGVEKDASPRPRFVRPLRDGTMRAFDPWNDDVLLGRYDAPSFPNTEDACHALIEHLAPGLDPTAEGAVIEVGCGTSHWLFPRMRRKGIRCYAVEPFPMPPLFDACSQSGTILVEAAMTDHDGKQAMYAGNTPDLTSCDPDWWGRRPDQDEGKLVHSVCLPTLLLRANIRKVLCLKIDVEGGEFTILSTLKHVPKESLPRVVMFEYGGTPKKEGKGGWTMNALASTHACLDALQALGYSRMAVIGNHEAPREFDLQDPHMTINVDLMLGEADYGNILCILPTELPPPFTLAEQPVLGGAVLDVGQPVAALNDYRVASEQAAQVASGTPDNDGMAPPESGVPLARAVEVLSTESPAQISPL